eukprot:1363145-Amorphochlora_amoeboformis.AAC.1
MEARATRPTGPGSVTSSGSDGEGMFATRSTRVRFMRSPNPSMAITTQATITVDDDIATHTVWVARAAQYHERMLDMWPTSAETPRPLARDLLLAEYHQ